MHNTHSERYVRISCPTLLPVRREKRPRVVLVPGWGNSSYNHWQSIWQRERQDCVRAPLGQWHNPDPERWIRRLDSCLDVHAPAVLVAHSLGCIATTLWAERAGADSRVIGALLVAPCDTEAEGASAVLRNFAPRIPSRALPFPSILIGSANDPYTSLERAHDLARQWGSTFVNAGPAGHLNANSNLGRWWYGQAFLDGLLTSKNVGTA